jgi:hypothetical protein
MENQKLLRMKNWILFLALLSSFNLTSQNHLGQQALVYRPILADLLHYAETQDKAALLQALQKQKPVDTLAANEDHLQLPTQAGVYILVYTSGNQMQFTIKNKEPLRVSLNNHNGHKRLYVLKNDTPELAEGAQVYHNGKKLLKYLPKEKAFKLWSPFKSSGHFLIVHNEVPTWVNWSEGYRQTNFFATLRRSNFYYFKRLFSRNKAFRKQRQYQQNMSYLALNKPLYRLGDTLHLKAFLLKSNNQPLKQPLSLEIGYYNPIVSKYEKKIVDTLYPYRPGAFSYTWRLPDSLLGKNVTLNLHNQKGQLLQTTQFLMQDYILNQVFFKAALLGSDNSFYPNLPLKISYEARDDLGLSPMQGNIRVQVKVGYFEDLPSLPVLVLPNILVDTLLPLDPTGKGIYTLPKQKLPSFETQLNISLTYQSADGERHEESFDRIWQPKPKVVHLRQNPQGLWVLQADSLFNTAKQDYYLQGASSGIEFSTYLPSDHYGPKIKVSLPYIFKAGLPEKWQLSKGDTILLNNTTDGKEASSYSWILRKDTLLYFPDQQGQTPPLLRVIANGKKLLFTGFLRDTLRLSAHYRYFQIYHTGVNSSDYPWVNFIPIRSRLKKPGSARLNLQAEGPENIFPGDSASWQLQLTKNQEPVANYDILALAYKEEQFKNTLLSNDKATVLNTRVHRSTYKKTPRETFFKENTVLDGVQENMAINPAWRQHLAADSLDAFKYMFPPQGLKIHYQSLDSPKESAQFAPFVYSGGKQHSVRYFSVNGRPHYMKDLSFGAYSAQVSSGLKTIVIRLEHQKITVPAVLLKQGFKTELALDLNQLPDSIKIEELSYSYTDEEVQLLSKYLGLFYLPKYAALSQGYQRKVWQQAGWQWLGPLALDQFKISTAQGDTFRLIFKGATEYNFDADNKILVEKANTRSAKKALQRHYHNREVQQWPGFQFKIPRAETIVKESHIAIPVYPLPSPEEGEGCFIALSPYYYGAEDIFVHHLSGNRLFKVEPYYLNYYAKNDWPSGQYQIYSLTEQSALVSDTFTLKPQSTAYVSLGGMHLLSVFESAERLQNITAHQKDFLKAEKLRLAQNENWSQWDDSEQLSEIIIAYDAPLIDATKSSKVITREDIQNMAVRDVTSYAVQSAGIRGGRAEGSMHFIDGVKIRGSVNIPQAAISFSNSAGQAKEAVSDQYQTEKLKTLAASGDGLRTNFKDYAFFIPNVTTNAQGQARLQVKYPDDKANWKTYFVGMGRKGTYALTTHNTLAFSPVSAALATPRYLYQGDSCVLLGKSLNYLDTALNLETYFTQNGDTLYKGQNKIENTLLEYLPVKAKDSLVLTYTLRLANGFSDGEKRHIPLLTNGLTKQEGHFFNLKRDTVVSVNFDSTRFLQVGIMQSTVQFLLAEVDLQMAYSHFCNEQMASKLRAILAINDINAASNRKENDKREAKKLIKKLLSNRNTDALWGWWGKQKTNPFMTAYVLESLLQAKAAGYDLNVNSSIEQAKNRMPQLDFAERIDFLFLFNQYSIDAAYRYYLSENTPQTASYSTQFKKAIIALQQGLAYDTSATEACVKKTILGHQYLPQDGPYSLQGKFGNTLLALQYFKNSNQLQGSQACLNYILVGRTDAALNTLERAALIKALSLSADADTVAVSLAYQVDNGPVQQLTSKQKRFTVKGKNIRLIKKGGGQAFVSFTDSRHYPAPAADETHFKVKSHWAKPPQVGEITNLILEIKPQQSAEYLMVEIPLPGGCTVAPSATLFGNKSVYQEVRGNKVYLYLRQMEGTFNYKLPLLARYAGKFNLNPVKIELMYFPTFGGNNSRKSVVVKAADKLKTPL